MPRWLSRREAMAEGFADRLLLDVMCSGAGGSCACLSGPWPAHYSREMSRSESIDTNKIEENWKAEWMPSIWLMAGILLRFECSS